MHIIANPTNRKPPQQQIAATIPDKKGTEKSIKINGVKDFNEEQE
jgi:hypothetical protein